MKLKGVCDRFEDGTAVIVLDGNCGEIYIIRARLPKGLKEGDVLDIEMNISKGATAERLKQAAALREKLLKKNKGDKK